MLALVTNPDNATGLDRTEVDEPDPAADQAVVAVHAASVNRGELRLLALRPRGWQIGRAHV